MILGIFKATILDENLVFENSHFFITNFRFIYRYLYQVYIFYYVHMYIFHRCQHFGNNTMLLFITDFYHGTSRLEHLLIVSVIVTIFDLCFWLFQS